jgi:hypothetical protein
MRTCRRTMQRHCEELGLDPHIIDRPGMAKKIMAALKHETRYQVRHGEDER